MRAFSRPTGVASLTRARLPGIPLWATLLGLAAALSVMEVQGFKQYHLLPMSWYLVGGATLACLIVLRFRVWQLTRPQ